MLNKRCIILYRPSGVGGDARRLLCIDGGSEIVHCVREARCDRVVVPAPKIVRGFLGLIFSGELLTQSSA
jgi:hypothetical protein